MFTIRFLSLCLATLPAAAGEPIPPAPYEPDAATLHLWHLDELKPPFRDEIGGGQELLGLLDGARANEPSMPGFRSSAGFYQEKFEAGTLGRNGAILLAAAAMANDGRDNVPDGFRYFGADGAFTLEAIVRFKILPAQMHSSAGGVVTMDGDGGNRIFNFRVERAGFLSFVPLLSLDKGAGSILAAIPTTGPHAVNTKDWFHVAVAYDGREGVSGNLTLYWTRLDRPLDSAHVIGSGTLPEDLRGLSDFAIGNESRGAEGEEPFPGWIDEVRISSVARGPEDFLMIPAAKRSPRDPDDAEGSEVPVDIDISAMIADDMRVAIPHGGRIPLRPGTQRLDFEFGLASKEVRSPVRFRCRLMGLEEQWMENESGMSLTCEALDSRGNVVSMVRRPISGTSRGWRTGFEDSSFQPWREPLFLPETTASVRLTVSSGPEDTAGFYAVDDLEILRRSADGTSVPVWANPGFEKGDRTSFPQGIPAGWKRGGSAPTIARLVHFGDNPALALLDGDQMASGIWVSTRPVPKPPPGGETVVLRGLEMFNVVSGNRHRATFTNLPPGDYSFEVTAISSSGGTASGHVAVPFSIGARLTSRPWFWALAAACVVGSLGIGVVTTVRHRSAHKVAILRLNAALAKDRARIARDMHDDLGTRITMLTMNASLADRSLAKSPQDTRRHLGNLAASARQLVAAMDDMVWAVEPSNDTLEALAHHLAGLADEIFRESAVRCATSIPLVVPGRVLHSDFRHHVSLAAKEALHNILRHAGHCEASMVMEISGEEVTITIGDNGRGFDTASPDAGNGLENLTHRLSHVGGKCSIISTPGNGTTVVLRCPLPPASGKNPIRT